MILHVLEVLDVWNARKPNVDGIGMCGLRGRNLRHSLAVRGVCSFLLLTVAGKVWMPSDQIEGELPRVGQKDFNLNVTEWIAEAKRIG